MKRFWIECAWIGGTLLLIPLQTILLPLLWTPLVTVDLILLGACALTFLRFPSRALEVALIGNTLLDIQSALPFGVMVATMTLAMIFLRFLRQLVLKQDHTAIFLIITILVSIFTRLVFHTFLFVFTKLELTIVEQIPWQKATEDLGIQLLLHSIIMLVGMMMWKQGKHFILTNSMRSRR